MPMPFNSQVPHFLEKTKAYCAKVLPLVFDNSLSYYESLCKFMHKLNECIDAINAQNLNIIEFTHMVSLEIEKFETYLENRMTDFENQLKSEWTEFKTELQSEWDAEKEINRIFRETMTTEFNNFKNLINTNFANLRTELINDLTTFKNNLEEQQDDFEQHILDLQTAFETREQAARVAYQNNLNNLFDVWKNQTLTYLTNSIDDWEDDTKAELQAYFELYISQQITTETASLQTAINNLNTNLNNERTARQNADDDLQDQINQLTPEGGIKADVPDIHGNSQLYKINQATQQRENIYPVINSDVNEDDRLFFNQYIIENTNYFTATTNGKLFARFSNSFTIPQNSITYIPDCFKLRIDDMQNVDPAVTTPFNALSMLDISINICYLNETNRTRIDWGILNSSSSGVGYVPRFETIDDHLYLVIPIELISYNTIDSVAGTIQLICSFSQYIGGNVAPQNPIVVDDDLSTTSTNPVQNRIITTALNNRPTLNTVNNLLTIKANQSDLTALSNTVDTKASQADLNSLTNTVNNKASQTELNILASEVQILANNEIKSELDQTLNQDQLYREDQQHNRTNIDPVCSFASSADSATSANTLELNAAPPTAPGSFPVLISPSANPTTTAISKVYKTAEMTFSSLRNELTVENLNGNAKTATKLSGAQTVLYESTTATTNCNVAHIFNNWKAVLVSLIAVWGNSSLTHSFFVPLDYLKTNNQYVDSFNEHPIYFVYVDDDNFRWFESQSASAMTYSEVKVIGLY